MLLCVFVTSILHLVQKKNLFLKGLGMLMNDQVCLKYLHKHPKIIMILYQSIVISCLFVWVLNPATQLSIFVWLLLLFFGSCSSRKFAFAFKLFLFDLSNVVLNTFTVMLFLDNRGIENLLYKCSFSQCCSTGQNTVVFSGKLTCLKK